MAGQYGIEVGDIQKRLSDDRVLQFTDDQNSGSIVTTTVDALILDAEAELHLAAGNYYDLPLRKESDPSSTPEGVKTMLVDRVCVLLIARRPEFLRSDQDEGGYWRDREKRILDWFKAIGEPDPSKRRLIPGAKPRTTAADVRAGAPEMISDCPRFTRDSMRSR